MRFSGISARWNTRYPIGNGGYVPGSARNWTALRVPQILYGLGLRSKKSAVEKLKGHADRVEKVAIGTIGIPVNFLSRYLIDIQSPSLKSST